MPYNKPDQIVNELSAAIKARCQPLSRADRDKVLNGLADFIGKHQGRRRTVKKKKANRTAYDCAGIPIPRPIHCDLIFK